MVNQYISDVISTKDIQSWGKGDKIVINAPTGSGKSYFVLNTLYDQAEGKILFITNRKILKQQVKADTKDKENIIILSYQQLTEILKNYSFDINQYQYIVADECHFFFTDSYFNSETDITLEYLTNLPNNITIFLSATCEIFKKYMKDKNIKLYGLNNQLMYEQLYYFESKDAIVRLLEMLPLEEKAIYFCSNITDAYNLHRKFNENSAFLCSLNKRNKKYMELSSEDIRQQIINDAKFDTQYLFTTKILDNGVNIKDRQLKHIITDIFDFDTIQQCIGRKRIIDDNDKINVYVKRFKQNSIQSYINQWNKYLKYGNEFMTLSKEEYLSKYGRFNTNGLVYNHLQSDGNIQLKLNDAYYYKLKSDIEDCEKITGYNQTTEFKIGHLKLLCDRYEIPVNDFKELDGSINMDTFNEQLAKFLNQKMFSEEQKVFKDFIKQNAVKIVSGSHGSLGINTINGYFEDNKIMYSLKSFQETGGERKGRRYWQLFRLT